MKKVALLTLLVAVLYGCGSGGDRGELIGVKSKRKWFSEKPYGMVKVEGSSFTMGKQDEDPLGAMNAPARTVTIQPFYMDETEITNSEYKQFVHWVRDSVARTRLAEQAELAGGDLGSSASSDDSNPETGDPSDVEASSSSSSSSSSSDFQGIQAYAYAVADTTNESPYDKYMREKYYEVEGDSLKPLNWDIDIVWNIKDSPDEDYVQVMDSLFSKKSESLNGIRIFKTELLNYRYQWFDNEDAARSREHRRKFLRDKILNIYPDTTVWIRDFNYSYNDPMHQEYFTHKAYENYPVVGVTWAQAKAFCHWRTKYKNIYQRGQKYVALVPSFRLPTEAEWEYAARGGLAYAKYPWGLPHATSDRGCFLANFKPVRGDYAADGSLYTVEANAYNVNGFGLYNMAGNVSEWTNTAYNQMSYYFGSTMNPNVENRENKRKIIRGGSWKDTSYFMEVASRDWEYADTARSYIGFRTVQDYLGPKKSKK